MLGLLLVLIVIGVLAGFVVRLLVLGRDFMSIGAMIFLGIVGSFVGGFLGYVFVGKDFNEGVFQPVGLFGFVIGAVIVLLLYNATSHCRSLLI